MKVEVEYVGRSSGNRLVLQGAPGAGFALALGAIVGLGVAAVTTSNWFEAAVLSLLTTLVVAAAELKISEQVLPQRTVDLVTDFQRHPELGEPLRIIVEAYASASSEGVESVVLQQAVERLEELSQDWLSLPANRLDTVFSDNRYRVAQTNTATREMLAVACDDIDTKFLSSSSDGDYRAAQDAFIARGGMVRRIFVYSAPNPAVEASMKEYASAGVEVWTADPARLADVGLDVPSMVVWDSACASESHVPKWSTSGPTTITYHFNHAEVRRIRNSWQAIKSHAEVWQATNFSPGSATPTP